MKPTLTVWQKFAIRFAGFDSAVAAHCGSPVVSKLTGLKYVILIPCVIAVGSYSMLVYFFNPDLTTALVFGVIASILIYFLERSILKYGKAGQFKIAYVGRIALAVSAGWLAAEILVIGVSNGAIKEQQFIDLANAKDSVNQIYSHSISLLHNEVKAQKNIVDSMVEEYNNEVKGVRSNKGSGIGVIAKDLYKQNTAAENKLRLLELHNDSATLKIGSQRDSILTAIEKSRGNDFLTRLESLAVVEFKHPKASFILWVFRVFLLSAELFPLFLKLSIGEDLKSYYEIEGKINAEAEERFEEKRDELKILAGKAFEVEQKEMEIKIQQELLQLNEKDLMQESESLVKMTKFKMNEVIEMAQYKNERVKDISGKLDAETFADVIASLEDIYGWYLGQTKQTLNFQEG